MTFNSPGLQNGDTIPHFKLYKTNGDSVDILTVLQQGKPVLLVGGSITCNVFRQKIAEINAVTSYYGSQINVFVVYLVEAHPASPDLSPYSGTVWVPAANVTDNCLFNQPTSYQQRQDLADTTDARYSITPEILVDGPCNAFWSNFGTAPNSGFIIRPDGILFKKHGWFNRQNVYDIYADIDSLLNMLTVPVISDQPKISFFPNPATDLLKYDIGNEEGSVEIMDLNGHLLYSGSCSGASGTLDLSGLHNGVYLLRFQGRTAIYRERVVIAR